MKHSLGLLGVATIVACSSHDTSSGSASASRQALSADGGSAGDDGGATGDDGGADQPGPPCHPNPQAAADIATVAARGDVAGLPTPLKNRLLRLAGRSHTVLPLQIFAEADGASQLFKYILIDTTGF